MGMTASRLDRSLTSLPDEERYFGLENFGNTCYCNSVLQALYFCTPFREGVLAFAETIDREAEETIYTCLADLFVQIHSHRKKSGVISPKKFVQRLKKDNDQFCGFMHQDAHEFLNHLLLRISEILEKEQREERENDSMNASASDSESLSPTWVQRIFEGKLVHETKCLRCETVTSREEVFMDLQLAIEHNCSLTSCLKRYSAKAVLDKRDKYFCEVCQCHQEAFRQNKIKQLPQILICHLMRFDERMRKLMYRVVFPMELKLCNTTDDAPYCDDVYNLFAVVVHSGGSLNHGHYVSLVKSHGHWLIFDDDHVEPIPDVWVERTFGSPTQLSKNTDRGYILFYEKSSTREINIHPSNAAVSSKASEAASMESEAIRHRVPNKSAGTSDSTATRSTTIFESGSKHSEDNSIRRADTAIESVSGAESAARKLNRTASGITATLKSFWNPIGRQSSAEADVNHSNYDRSIGEGYHVSSHPKTNPIESNGL